MPVSGIKVEQVLDAVGITFKLEKRFKEEVGDDTCADPRRKAGKKRVVC